MPAGDRRNQLLETALEAFARRGFEGTTTKEIAAAAGITEAVIFRHFPSKQALYEAVLQHGHQTSEFEEWLADARACMERNDDEGLFRVLANKIVQSYRKDSRCQRVLLFAALEGHEQGLAFNRQLSIPVMNELLNYILRRQQEGALQAFPAGSVVAAIAGMAAYYSMMTQWFGFSSDMADEEVIDAFTEIMMNGIRMPDQTRTKEEI
jgi:TetR/AcrR family transcriptional regulator